MKSKEIDNEIKEREIINIYIKHPRYQSIVELLIIIGVKGKYKYIEPYPQKK